MQPLLSKDKKKLGLSVLILILGLSGNTPAIMAHNSEFDVSEASATSEASEANLLMHAELAPQLQNSFNQQVNSELDGAYAYLDLANHFYQMSLDGFGHWFTVQFYEEVNHARMITNFLTARGAVVKMASLLAPAVDKGTPLEILQASLGIEEAQTKKIHNLYGLAISLNQYEATSFLNFFLNEQVQEEDMFRNIVDKLTLLAGDPAGLLALDKELAARVMPPPFNPVAAP